MHRILTDYGRCLDASGDLTFAQHVGFEQMDCSGSDSQSFNLTHVGGGHYELVVVGSSDCMDIEGGAPEDETRIVRSPCDQRASQRWLIRDLGNATFALINQQTSKCLDVRGGSSTSGTFIIAYRCNQSAAQTWRLLTLEPRALPVVVDLSFFVTPSSAVGAAQAELVPSMANPVSDCNGNRPVNAQGNCHIASFEAFPAEATHVSASWLNFPGNWSRFPGLPIAPGATQISFQARGERGGEVVTFHASNTMPGAFPGTYGVADQILTLDSSWQRYSFDLTGVDYSGGVSLAFGWTAELAGNTAPLRFYTDDIVWQ